MDDVGSAAVTAIQQAAGEIAKQAGGVIGQLANGKDPIAWITGEDEVGDEDEDLSPAPSLDQVPLAALRSWGANSALAGVAADEAHKRSTPFMYDAALNGKVYLWQGDLLTLELDAMVAPTAANFTCGASTIFPRALRHGGKDLRAELECTESCRSGEARLVKAHNLNCSRLVLTVGPKYKEKYQTAAQNTLNACYRECFQLLVEGEFRTLGIPCTWYSKGYPADEQAHVALRTARRCLEKLGQSIDAVVFVGSTPQEVELYESIMPLYFPRSGHEAELGASVLPESCWTDWGEVAVEERRIFVSGLVRPEEDEDDRGDDQPLFSQGDDNDRAFLLARDDADDHARRRLEGTMLEAETLELKRQACLRYLRRAREMQAEPEAWRFVFRAGQDRTQRHVVVLLGARLPALGVRDERTLALFVKELELLNGESFVLLYVNSCVASLDSSKLEVLHEMLSMISARYRQSLAQLFVLHPGLWFRAAFALGRAMSDEAARAWESTVYIEGLAELPAFINMDRLNLPEYVRGCEGSF